MTTTISQFLPEYENPPVVEVVCGVLFKPIEALLVPHLGLLWEKFKPDYPRCQEVAPLTPMIERFDESLEMEFRLADTPPLPRIWFVHTNGNGIIQVQRDRFLHNWRKVRPGDEHPRYHNVIQMFRDRLSRFQMFLEETDLGTLMPMQYEMTYINHIPQGDGWEAIGDIGKVFPDFVWRINEQRFLSVPEGINWRTSFTLPSRAGRLHMIIRSAVCRSDERPMLLFELTARGIGNYTSFEKMWGWFDLAREWIVRGFADLTGYEVQKNIWRRRK